MKLGPNQKKWLAALESGRYEQGRGYLNCKNKFCCLGVACDLFHPTAPVKLEGDYDGLIGYPEENGHVETSVATKKVVEALKLRDNCGSPLRNEEEDDYEGDSLYLYQLTTLNDDHNATLKQIARIVRDNPERYFTSPA